MIASAQRRFRLLLPALIALSYTVACGALEGTPVIRIALLPSASEEMDRKLVRVACQIGGLTPQFQHYPNFDAAESAWQRGEMDAIAGITLEQAIVLGGRFLTAYRELRLRAVTPEDSLVRRPIDLDSVPVMTLPDGWGTLHARTRGWKTLEAGSFEDAAKAMREQKSVLLMDQVSTLLLPGGYREIDLGIAAPVSMAIPVGSAHARSLELGLKSLIRTGYADRFCKHGEDNRRVGGGWIHRDVLILGLIVTAGAGLVLAQQHGRAPGAVRPRRSVLATGRC